MNKAYEIADRLMAWVSDLLQRLTGEPSPVWDQIVYSLLVFVIAIVVGRILRAIVIYGIHLVVRYRGGSLMKGLVKAHLFTRLTHIIPPLVILSLLPFAFHGTPAFLKLIEKLCWIYVLGVIVFSINTQLTVFWEIYSSRTALRNRPMKGMIQIIRGLLAGFWVTVIVFLATPDLIRNDAFRSSTSVFSANSMEIVFSPIAPLVGLIVNHSSALSLTMEAVQPPLVVNAMVLTPSFSSTQIFASASSARTMDEFFGSGGNLSISLSQLHNREQATAAIRYNVVFIF